MKNTNPLIFGHRGASEDAPENTLKAFQLALSQGADGIETDLRFTQDGVLICFHDNDLRRVADRPEKISDLCYEELCQLIESVPYYRGESVPTLAHLLVWRPPNCALMLELKDEAFLQPAAMQQFKEQLIAAGNLTNVWISSFNEYYLASAHSLMPDIPLVWISRELIPLDALWTQGYSPHYTILEQNPDLCEAYLSAGKMISVWDPHPEERFEFHLHQQVSAITPNAPWRWIERLKARQQSSD